MKTNITLPGDLGFALPRLNLLLLLMRRITRNNFSVTTFAALVVLMGLTSLAINQVLGGSTTATTPTPSPTPPSPPVLKQVESDDVVRISSNLIVVPVSVTDSTGTPIQGLKADDFRLEEENKLQQIAQIGDPEEIPLEMAILLDVSGSVKGRFGFEKEAAARFIKSILKPKDSAVLYAIDSTPRLIQPRANAFQVTAGLESINATESPTAFYDTVVDAANYLIKFAPSRHRRVILAISDGEDTFSEKIRNVSATLPEVLRSEAIFYSINPAGPSIKLNVLSTRGQNEMQTLANTTGGVAFLPDAAQDLDAIFRQIAAELRSQYLLEYYGKSEAPSGTFLHVKVRVPKQPDLHIRARQGYYIAHN